MINSFNLNFDLIYKELDSILLNLITNNIITVSAAKKLFLIIYYQRLLEIKDPLIESLLTTILANIFDTTQFLDNFSPNCTDNLTANLEPIGKHVSKFAYEEFKDLNDITKSELFLILSKRLHNLIEE